MDEKEFRMLLIKSFDQYVMDRELGQVSIFGDCCIRYTPGSCKKDVQYRVKGNSIYVEILFSKNELAVAKKLNAYINKHNLNFAVRFNDKYAVFTPKEKRNYSLCDKKIKRHHLEWMVDKANELNSLLNEVSEVENRNEISCVRGLMEKRTHNINPKEILALAFILWDICNYVGYPIECHEIKDGETLPRIKFLQRIIAKASLLKIKLVDYSLCLERFLSNGLFTSDSEVVRLVLDEFWGVAQVHYGEEQKESMFRPFKLEFGSSALIIKELFEGCREDYFGLLLLWSGLADDRDVSNYIDYEKLEKKLIKILTIYLDSSFIKIDNDFKFKFVHVISSSLKKDDKNRILYVPEQAISNRLRTSDSLSAKLSRALLKQGLHYYLGDFKGSRISRNADIDINEYKSYAKLSAAQSVVEKYDTILECEYVDVTEESKLPVRYDSSNLITGAQNILLYGAPGVGKSYAITSEYCSDEDMMIRVVFHPEYSYADFVGQIHPVLDCGSVVYKFIPGPFTDALMLALQHPASSCYLVIEELNRGQAPAIFGEIFQLLDRREETDGNRLAGESLYGVTSRQIAEYLFGDPMKKIRIPANLNIIATMNTSDQNVFTLDTAFQRRWNMRYIENDFTSVPHKDSPILGSDVTWMHFAKTINDVIVSSNSGVAVSEDKRLGRYFVRPQDLACVNEEHMENVDEVMLQRPVNLCFAEKVVKYLWDDAFRYSRADLFDLDNVNTLDEAIAKFNGSSGNDRFRIFNSTVYDELVRSESK